jgi:hypothetical protein
MHKTEPLIRNTFNYLVTTIHLMHARTYVFRISKTPNTLLFFLTPSIHP